MLMEVQNFFPGTSELHNSIDQIKRQKSSVNLTVHFVDAITGTGNINKYAVSLTGCDCVDFKRRSLPCKHMYRLACELGVFRIGDDVAKDTSLKTSSYVQIERDALKAKISHLSDSSQHLLQKCVSLHERFFSAEFQPEINELVEAGFVTSRPICFMDIAYKFTIADVLKLCTDIQPPKKNRRNLVMTFFVEHYTDTADRLTRKFSDGKVCVELTETIETELKTVQRFLSQKLGNITRDRGYEVSWM